jgi:NAD(P)-dependent dehydrogenase (short-subunit alcohol dehydrogenase family)
MLEPHERKHADAHQTSKPPMSAESRAVARLSSRYPARRILITGATSGSGEALAVLFGRHGWRVAVTGRNRERVALSAKKVRAAGGQVLEIDLEVTRYEDFERAARHVAEAWGGLDILVNNAGVTGGESIEDDSIDLWHRIIDINTFGVVHGCKAFAPILRESGGGHIVNVASVAAFVSAPEMASYNVSKAAVLSLSETLDAELAPHHIDVTVACPGVFQSELGAEGRVLASPNARMMKSLRREQETTSQTAEDVVGKIVVDMARKRLYSLPGGDLRAQWIIKRISPEFSRRLIAFLYARRLWKFAEMGE